MPVKRVGAGARARNQRSLRHSTKRKNTVSIIGAGRLGTALAIALARRGYPIEAVVARRPAHARRAAELTGTHPLALSGAQLDRLPPSDLLIITTPDDAIAATAAQLAASIKLNRRAPTALHASGALSSEVLEALRDVGFCLGSMHPLVSISDPISGAESLSSAFYCVEGEPKAVRVAHSLVRDLGGQSFSLKARDKALYHAAAVMASGHMVALFDIATEMLMRCGLTAKRARAVLMPLTRSTLENLARREPASALTGTFVRADIATVGRHLEALGLDDLRDALAAYVLLGRRSLQLAGRVGVDAKALTEIAHAFNQTRR